MFESLGKGIEQTGALFATFRRDWLNQGYLDHIIAEDRAKKADAERQFFRLSYRLGDIAISTAEDRTAEDAALQRERDIDKALGREALGMPSFDWDKVKLEATSDT